MQVKVYSEQTLQTHRESKTETETEIHSNSLPRKYDFQQTVFLLKKKKKKMLAKYANRLDKSCLESSYCTVFLLYRRCIQRGTTQVIAVASSLFASGIGIKLEWAA